MTPRQQAMYWAEWGKLRDVLRARGKTSAEIEAHRGALTVRALGAAKSSKLFTNSDLDRVIAAIKAATQPSDFAAQMRQQNQPDERRAAALARCDAACVAMADRSCGEYQFATAKTRAGYIAGMSKKLCGKWPEACDDVELNKCAGVLEARVKQLERAMSAHLAPPGAAPAPAAAGAQAGAAGTAARLEPGEDF